MAAGRTRNASTFVPVPFSATRAQGLTSTCFCSVLLRKKNNPRGLRVGLMEPREWSLWDSAQPPASGTGEGLGQVPNLQRPEGVGSAHPFGLPASC